MLVMLGGEGVRPEHWVGYAQYITLHAREHAAEAISEQVKSRPRCSLELMAQWPDPESVMQAVATPDLDPWRRSIRETRSLSLPKDTWLLGLSSSHYSPLLAECRDAPSFLYGRGDLGCFRRPAIAIVGSRRPSLDGLRLAEHFAFELAKAGFVIVSGLAQGVDTAAHKGALAAGGNTVAVMATGIDAIYPSVNRALSNEIVCSGALVTEFSPDSAPKPHHFRRRNRTISGLSIATVVIEAGVPSGTLITATAAAEQGRDVYALPWSINHRQGEGCLKLLLEGALLATDPRDVIEGSCWSQPISEATVIGDYRSDYGVSEKDVGQDVDNALQQNTSLQSKVIPKEPPDHDLSANDYSLSDGGSRGLNDYADPPQTLTVEQQSLLQLMGDGHHSAESLSTATGSDIRVIYQLLAALEILGFVTRHRSSYRKR